MKKLPLGIQSFAKIVEGGYVYADKTRHVYNLINGPSYCFLSRPRRFGKSLLLDTLAEAFRGSKELFMGLWIYDSDYAFEKHPVIRLDMSNISTENSEILKESIVHNLRQRITEEGFDINGEIPSDLFVSLIKALYRKYDNRVVVLIDEYDKPMLDHLHDPDMAEANRQVMRGFYGILKSMDPYLRFTMITGVSKFTKTSIFSELNNLIDITMLSKYADICGINMEDLGPYFGEHIEHLAALDDLGDYDEIYARILEWYDGYTWDGKTRVINPFSLLCFFEHAKFERFWYSSGSPKFLIDLIKDRPASFLNLKNLKIWEWMLDSFDIRQMKPEPLLFQTGYLTVKEVQKTKTSPIYVLEMPNHEVREAFNTQVVSALTESGDLDAGQAHMEMSYALNVGDLEKMLGSLRRLFASIPYNLHVDAEAYYHSIFYAVMTVLGFDMDVEVSVSGGRADAVLELDDRVYVMEFKHQSCGPQADVEEKRLLFDRTLTEAMEQIKERGYHKPYIDGGKTLYLAAFAFLGRDAIEMRAEILK